MIKIFRLKTTIAEKNVEEKKQYTEKLNKLNDSVRLSKVGERVRDKQKDRETEIEMKIYYNVIVIIIMNLTIIKKI